METIMKAVTAKDKRVVNGTGDINQLAPFKYPWAYEFWLNANKNHWMPFDINMLKDVEDYNYVLGDSEKHVFENVLAYLTTSDILAMRNIAVALLEKMTAPELQLYQARQIYEECLTEDHEVLTVYGWKPINQITKGEKVLCFNGLENEPTFNKTTRVINYDYKGEIHEFKSQYMSQKVTSNHRMPYINRKKELKIKKAGEFPEGLQGNGFISNGTVTIKDVLTPDQRFLIALQADGTIFRETKEGKYKNRNGVRSKSIRCTFELSKSRKLIRLLNLLNEMGWDYKVKNSKTPETHVQRKRIAVNVPLTVHVTKSFKDWVDLEDVDPTWAKAFIKELSYWDGWDYLAFKGTGYDTTDDDNAEIVHSLGVMGGFRVSRSLSIDKRGYKPLHRFYFVDKQIGRSAVNKVTSFTEEKVYCLTVPSGMFYVRRNGVVSVTGNSLHSVTYQHCIETIGLDQEVIYNRYRVVPEINAKIKMTNQMIDPLIGYDVDLSDREKLQDFLLGYIFFSAIFEGSWFYNGFSPIYSLQRRGLMKGTGEQLQYIQRDETLHASFGIRVIKQLMLEENIRPDPIRLKRMVDMADEVEKNYINYILPEPIKGYNAEDHHGQYRFILNRRFRQLGFDEPYKNTSNKLPWLDEQASIRKEKNFFETRVTEYQTGVGLDWSK